MWTYDSTLTTLWRWHLADVVLPTWSSEGLTLMQNFSSEPVHRFCYFFDLGMWVILNSNLMTNSSFSNLMPRRKVGVRMSASYSASLFDLKNSNLMTYSFSLLPEAWLLGRHHTLFWWMTRLPAAPCHLARRLEAMRCTLLCNLPRPMLWWPSFVCTPVQNLRAGLPSRSSD